MEIDLYCSAIFFGVTAIIGVAHGHPLLSCPMGCKSVVPRTLLLLFLFRWTSATKLADEVTQLHGDTLKTHTFLHHPPPHTQIGTHTTKQAEQKEKCRDLEARLRVHERRLSAEVGRWKEEADRADEMSGRIGSAESERDAAVKR